MKNSTPADLHYMHRHRHMRGIVQELAHLQLHRSMPLAQDRRAHIGVKKRGATMEHAEQAQEQRTNHARISEDVPPEKAEAAELAALIGCSPAEATRRAVRFMRAYVRVVKLT